MDLLSWMPLIGITIILSLLFGLIFRKSYDLANWLGIGVTGFLLLWGLVLSSIYPGYKLYGELAVYQIIFIVIVFCLNYHYMWLERRKEALVKGLQADIESLDNQLLKGKLEKAVQTRLGILQTPEEHRRTLKDTLKSASETVIILSGWATNYTLDGKFRALLGRCLKRGVMVYIGYGYQKRGAKLIKQEVEDETRDTLEDLQEWCSKKKWEGRLEVFLFPNHAKILIKDNEYAIHGNFNWLSKLGPGLDEERSWIVYNKDLVTEERDKIILGL